MGEGREKEGVGRERGREDSEGHSNLQHCGYAPALLKNVLCPFPNRQSSSIAIGKAIGYNTAISSITILRGKEKEGRGKGGGREEEEGQERKKGE